MKKNTLFILAIIGMMFASCNKEDKDPEAFSQKTVEENKEIIEESGIEMMNTMDDMANLDAIEVCINLGEVIAEANPMSNKDPKKSKLSSTVNAIAGLNENTDLNKFFNQLLSAEELSEDPQTIQEMWEEILGTYSWNSTTDSWDYAANDSEAVILFPALDNSTTNDGKVRVYGYSSVVIDNPLDEEYSGDIPAALAFEISVNDQVIITYTFAAAYTDEGVPSMVASDLSIPPFKWEIDITNNTKEISMNYKLTHNNNIVLELGGAANGTFTEQNVNDNIVTITKTDTWTNREYNSTTGEYEDVTHINTYEREEFMFEEVANAAIAHFQLMDIKIKGEVDIKGLTDEIRAIEEKYDLEVRTDENRAQEDAEIVEVINEYAKLMVLNVKAKEKIADVEAYVVTETYGDNEIDTWIDFRLVFGDGSTVDSETYVTEGFDNFIDEVNDFIDDLNEEYDLGFDNID